MSRITPGRPAKSEWQRAMTTAKPGFVYSWYMDIKFRCQRKPHSPTTKPIEQVDGSQVFEGFQTIYLGTYETVRFRAVELELRTERMSEWITAHPECIILEAYKSYRHYRGSSL